MRLLLTASSALTLAVTTADEYFTGEGTAYTLGHASAGNCNMMSALDFATTDYVALNNEQWSGLQNCGRCVEVSCADDRCADQNKKVTVQILDRCPECKHGDLDLSPSVFLSLTGSTPSRYKVKWKFKDCPVQSNVNYCLKGGSNNFWTAVQPTNVATGVTKLQINGKDTKMLDSAYYYVLDGAGQTQTDLSSMTITTTDLNGNTIEDTVSLSADSCTEGTSQFPFQPDTPSFNPSPSLSPPTPSMTPPTPSELPTEPPTEYPTEPPTPSELPTEPPTEYPTELPTLYPTEPPTEYPTELPTLYPTEPPTEYPTELPTEYPTEPPTYPTEPPTYPTEPPTYPTEPPTYPTEPPTYPTEPPTYPTEPPTYPTEPPTYPTEPPTYPTEPPTYPTEPPTYPTEPPTYPTVSPAPLPTMKPPSFLPPLPSLVPITPTIPTPPLPTFVPTTPITPTYPAPPLPSFVPATPAYPPPGLPSFVPTTPAYPTPGLPPLTPTLNDPTQSSPELPNVKLYDGAAKSDQTIPDTSPIQQDLPATVHVPNLLSPEDAYTTDLTPPITGSALSNNDLLTNPITQQSLATTSILNQQSSNTASNQQSAGQPASATSTQSNNPEQTTDNQLANDPAMTVNTKSKESSNGTDSLIIVLSTLGGVGVVALIVVVVIAKRKTIQQAKVRDEEAPSMISAESFDVQNPSSDRRQAFGML